MEALNDGKFDGISIAKLLDFWFFCNRFHAQSRIQSARAQRWSSCQGLTSEDLKSQEKLLSAEFMRLVVTPATQACSRLLGFSNFLVSIVEISLCHIMKCKKEVDFSVS